MSLSQSSNPQVRRAGASVRTAHGVYEMRHVLIVARDRPDLYDDFRVRFARRGNVEILIDRRVADRRQRDEGRIPNRRREQRRTSAADVKAALWTEGYIIVRTA